MNSTSDPPLGLTFGRFRVLPDRRELVADGRPVTLGGRAFDVLMALIEGRGAVVSKQALMARVWPGRAIEENSLAAQIAALRAAFGGGARADPHGLRARLSVHRRYSRGAGEPWRARRCGRGAARTGPAAD
jgi:DNA-binding response OmpR family regulator